MPDPVIEEPSPVGPRLDPSTPLVDGLPGGLSEVDGGKAGGGDEEHVLVPGARRRAREEREAMRRKAPKSSARNLIEWIVVLGGALLIAFVVRLVLFQAFFIPSGSMEPTLKVQDRVVVNKLSYSLHDVHRKDIVVFARPPGVDPKNKDLIKRVIGLPGETVSLRDGAVFIDGHPLVEPYTAPGSRSYALHFSECRANLDQPLVIPKGDVFVMGDNRQNSIDSRCFGSIPDKLIVGRAFVRVWPLSRLGTL